MGHTAISKTFSNMNNEKYQIYIVKKINDTLINQWKELWKKGENANIFNSYEWFLTCLETYNIKDYELHVSYSNEKLVAILALCVYRRFGVKVSSTLCNNFLVDTAFLLEKFDKKLLKYFFSAIIVKRNLYIQKIDNKSAEFLQNLFPDMFFSLISANPYVDISKDNLASISPTTHRQIKRIIKKNPNQFSFKIYGGTDNLSQYLMTMFNLEQNSSKKLRAMDLFSKKENREFFTNLVKNCSPLIKICILYYNNHPLAYQFGFLYNNIFHAYQTSYLFEYAKLRPGKTMLFHLLENLKKNNIDALDLGGGMSMYKLEFTSSYRLLYDLYYSKNIFITLWWKSINLLRRIKQIIFPKKFTRDHEFLFKTL